MTRTSNFLASASSNALAFRSVSWCALLRNEIGFHDSGSTPSAAADFSVSLRCSHLSSSPAPAPVASAVLDGRVGALISF